VSSGAREDISGASSKLTALTKMVERQEIELSEMPGKTTQLNFSEPKIKGYVSITCCLSSIHHSLLTVLFDILIFCCKTANAKRIKFC
jgi:hypothetical protein